MDTVSNEVELEEPRYTSSNPDVLVAAALHLMSNYMSHPASSGGCTKLAAVIERHLRALTDRADLSPVLRATCGQLSEQWSAVVERALPAPGRTNFARRLLRAM